MKSVVQILKSKASHSVATIPLTSSACEAAAMMAEHGIGALLVMDGERIAGIVSERDFARKLVQHDRSCRETRVADIMTAPVMYVEATRTNEECMALMTDSRLRHLPVLDHGKLIGLVSIGDLVKDVISDQQFTIDQLVNYIMGTHT